MNSKENIEGIKTTDILTIMRELERRQELETKPTVKDTPKQEETKPDPALLLDSLQRKRALLGLIDGCPEVKDMDSIKTQLNEAIDFLEKFIKSDDARCA